MEEKHERIKIKVLSLINKSKSEEEISNLLNIPLGTNFRDKFSVKWYLRCIQLNSIASLGGKAVHKKHPDLNKGLVRIMHKKTKERMKNDQKFAEYMHQKSIERGKLTHKKHPGLARKIGKISQQKIKIYRKDPSFDKKYCLSRFPGARKGGKIMGPKHIKIMRKSLTKDALSRGGKKGGPIGGRKVAEILRKRKHILFEDVAYDSNMELECAKLFIKYKIVDKLIENCNCHIKIGTKDFDFFPQRKIFVEFHPLAIFDSNESYESYYNKWRKVLDSAGYKNYPLVVLPKLKEFEEKVLPHFKNQR